MVGAVLYYQSNYAATWFGGYQSWLLIYEFIAITIIALFGVHECLKANGGEEGHEFLKRYSVVSVPVGLKLALAGLLLSRVIYYGFPYVVTPTTFRDPVFVFHILSFLISASFAFVYFWRIRTHLARVVEAQRPNPSLNKDAPPAGGAPVS